MATSLSSLAPILATEVDSCINAERKAKVGEHVGATHYLACDFGLRRDRAVVAVGHRSRKTKKVILDHMKTFYPPGKDGRISVKRVENEIYSCLRRFRPIEQIVADPWQLEGTIQKLEARGWDVWRFVFSGGNLTLLTQELMRHVVDGYLEIYEYEELIKELKNVQAVQKHYGFRIDHESGQHDDHAITLGMLILAMLPEAEYDDLSEDEEGNDPFGALLQPNQLDMMLARMRSSVPL